MRRSPPCSVTATRAAFTKRSKATITLLRENTIPSNKHSINTATPHLLNEVRGCIFYLCRFEPRPLKSTHDFWCGCPQPDVLKIAKFPFGENYSNTPKSMQALKSLISCGVWRFLILIFTCEKEHKTGSKKRQKHKNQGRRFFAEQKEPLKTLGFQGFRWRRGWDSNPCDVAVKLISSQLRYDHFDTSPHVDKQNLFHIITHCPAKSKCFNTKTAF